MAHHRLLHHQLLALAAATSLFLVAAASPVHTTATPPASSSDAPHAAAVFRGARRLAGPPHHRSLSEVPTPAPAAALPSDDGAADGYMIAKPFHMLLGGFVGCVVAFLLDAVFRKVAALLAPCVAALCAGDDDDQDGAEAAP